MTGGGLQKWVLFVSKKAADSLGSQSLFLLFPKVGFKKHQHFEQVLQI